MALFLQLASLHAELDAVTDIYLTAPGEPAAIESLEISRARDLSAYLVRGVHPWARFIETRSQNTRAERIESVVFDVDVELSQLTRFDIHRSGTHQRIVLGFG